MLDAIESMCGETRVRLVRIVVLKMRMQSRFLASGLGPKISKSLKPKP